MTTGFLNGHYSEVNGWRFKKNQIPQDTVSDLKLFFVVVAYFACFSQNCDVWEKDGIWN